MNPNTLSDKDLDRDERELAALYRRLPKAEPDAALDARVLAEAHRAITGSPRHRTPPWIVGLGTAAVLVLVVGIAWRLQPTPQQRPTLESEPAAAARESADAIQKQAAPRAADADISRERAPLSKPGTSAGNIATHAANQWAVPQTERQAGTTTATNEAAGESRARAVEPQVDRAAIPEPQPASAPSAPAALSPLSTSPAVGSSSAQSPKKAEISSESSQSEQGTGAIPSAQSLVHAARMALREGNRDTARERVRTLLRHYPNFALPPDLVPLAPAGDEKVRHR